MASRRLEEAHTLFTERWAKIFAFDLDAETLNDLFSRYQAGTLLEALKYSSNCVDQRPDKAYGYFLRSLQRAAAKYEPTIIH